MLTIGCHLSTTKGYAAMGETARSIGANTFAVFTRNPRGGNAKPLDLDDVAGLQRILDEDGFGRLVAHAPYTYNPCSAKERARAFALEAMAEDLQRGIIDRFRSLPMAKGAVLAGRTVSDFIFSTITVTALVLTGLLVGWRTHAPFPSIVAGFALLALFAYAFLWIGAVIGMSVRSPEVAQTAGLIWLFPLTFISNAFVPVQSMPSWLQPIAEWNPISCVVQALRELFGNLPPGYNPGDSFPMQNPILMSLIWCFGLLAVFIPLGVSRYRKAASR